MAIFPEISFWFAGSYFLLALGYVVALLLVAHIIRDQRSPSGAIAWLLIIVLLPYLGVPLYLIFGGRKVRRLAQRKAGLSLPPRPNHLPAERIPTTMDRTLKRVGLPGVTGNNRVRLYQTGEEIFAELMSLIDGAEKYIHITAFLLGRDTVGRAIVGRLAARAAEGIEVRLLLDAVGSLVITRRFLRPLITAGGRVAFFMPVLRLPLRGWTNLRNHRKMVIVDERWVMAGGANLARNYIGPTPQPNRWRDLQFILEGPATRDFADIFRADWEFASGEHPEPPGESSASPPVREPGALVQVIPSGPDVTGDFLYDAILSAVFAARQRFWIVTPYFVPDETLYKALQIAAHRGVNVRIIVPQRSNHRLVDWARTPYLRQIQGDGGGVEYYTAGMLHAKAMLMDDSLAVIGSANIDMRSLLLNYEVMMVVYSPEEIRAIEAWISSLPTSVRPQDTEPGLLKDIGEGLVRMVAPLL
jgi:cardiolipin synthase